MKLVSKNPGRQLLYGLILCSVLLSCGTKSGDNTPEDASPDVSSTDTKFTQYYVKGEQLYTKYCSNCHQKNGTGLGRLYPPLNASDYMQNHPEDVICIMRFGKAGEIIVNGKSFNKEMPANPSLTDLEIAQIATYIYNSWGMKRGIIEVKSVSQTLNSCK